MARRSEGSARTVNSEITGSRHDRTHAHWTKVIAHKGGGLAKREESSLVPFSRKALGEGFGLGGAIGGLTGVSPSTSGVDSAGRLRWR